MSESRRHKNHSIDSRIKTREKVAVELNKRVRDNVKCMRPPGAVALARQRLPTTANKGWRGRTNLVSVHGRRNLTFYPRQGSAPEESRSVSLVLLRQKLLVLPHFSSLCVTTHHPTRMSLLKKTRPAADYAPNLGLVQAHHIADGRDPAAGYIYMI